MCIKLKSMKTRMKRTIKFLLIALLFSGCSGNVTKNNEDGKPRGPRKVELKNIDGKHRLFIDGEVFYVKGAGCDYGDVESLARHGANSLRTWTSEGEHMSGQELLDEAEKHGLYVLMGLGMWGERHGFDYSDSASVASQFEELQQAVLKYKDHPALLGWGIGNELNLMYTNKKVWNVVNDIAEMIHRVDGNHPTTTMLAGIKKEDVDYIKEHCPALDFLSIQSYGEIVKLETSIANSGYSGAYLVTEWGPNGHWEVEKTKWGAPIEQTSTEKANVIKDRYENIILKDSANCMGSYVFLWGQKQERTPTWYSFFTENGEEMEAIDVMHYSWNNKWPENRTPRIIQATIEGKTRFDNIELQGGVEAKAKIAYEDEAGDVIEIDVEILAESTDLKVGGDFENRPKEINEGISVDEACNISFRVPTDKGAYRLFIYVKDDHNHAGTVNLPFKVI